MASEKVCDLAARKSVAVAIVRAGGAAEVPENAVSSRLAGPSAELATLGKRMRCSKCGVKGAEVVAIAIPRTRGEAFGDKICLR